MGTGSRCDAATAGGRRRRRAAAKGEAAGKRHDDVDFVEAWLNRMVRKEVRRALVQAERELKRKATLSVPIDVAAVLHRALRIRAVGRSRPR